MPNSTAEYREKWNPEDHTLETLHDITNPKLTQKERETEDRILKFHLDHNHRMHKNPDEILDTLLNFDDAKSTVPRANLAITVTMTAMKEARRQSDGHALHHMGGNSPPPQTEAEVYFRTLNQSAEESFVTLAKAAAHTASPEFQHQLQETLQAQGVNLQQWATNLAHQEKDHITSTARHDYAARYCLPVITEEAVQMISGLRDEAGFVEIGAGNGYLSRELQRHGLDTHATEPRLRGQEQVDGVLVQSLTAMEAVQQYPDRSIVWSWPESSAYTGQALAAFQGRYLVYIGEPEHTECTGSPQFHRILRENFQEIERLDIPTFTNFSDSLVIFERKTAGPDATGHAADHQGEYQEHDPRAEFLHRMEEALPPDRTIVVGNATAQAQYQANMPFLQDPAYQHAERPTPEEVAGKKVLGFLPMQLAVHAESVTEYVVHSTLQDRQNRGDGFSQADMAARNDSIITYRVHPAEISPEDLAPHDTVIVTRHPELLEQLEATGMLSAPDGNGNRNFQVKNHITYSHEVKGMNVIGYLPSNFKFLAKTNTYLAYDPATKTYGPPATFTTEALSIETVNR